MLFVLTVVHGPQENREEHTLLLGAAPFLRRKGPRWIFPPFVRKYVELA